MVFIVQPTEEGETKECPNCDVELVGRLSDYKGRFPDKLQWQSKSERKAHYDKNGNCKEESDGSNAKSNIPSQTPAASNPPSQTSDEYLKNKKTELEQETRDFDDKMQKLIVSTHTNDELTRIYKDIDKLIALEHLIKSKFEERGIELNAQKIGLYIKLVRGVDNE